MVFSPSELIKEEKLWREKSHDYSGGQAISLVGENPLQGARHD